MPMNALTLETSFGMGALRTKEWAFNIIVALTQTVFINVET